MKLKTLFDTIDNRRFVGSRGEEWSYARSIKQLYFFPLSPYKKNFHANKFSLALKINYKLNRLQQQSGPFFDNSLTDCFQFGNLKLIEKNFYNNFLCFHLDYIIFCKTFRLTKCYASIVVNFDSMTPKRKLCLPIEKER